MPITARSQAQDHSVQFYEDERFLVDVIADYLLAGVTAGERLLVALTAPRLAAVTERLAEQELDTREAIAEGRLVVLDAHVTLAAILRNGMPDAALFERHVLGALAMGTDHSPVRAYGELVDLLCEEGNPEAAIRLEALWDEACARLPLRLLCAYSMAHFQRPDDGRTFHAICHGHAQVRPADDYGRLQDPGDRLRQITLLQQRARALEHEIASRKRIEATLDQTHRLWRDIVSDLAVQVDRGAAAGRRDDPTPEQQALRSVHHGQDSHRVVARRALRDALPRGELELYYQPLIEARSGRVVAMEALPRWNSAVFGPVGPRRLMDLAEDTREAATIGRWMLERVCRQGQAWLDAGLGLKMTVNLSTAQLLHEDSVERIAEVLAETGLAGEMLEIELTETMLMRDPDHTSDILRRLKALGVGLAVDRFGSGHSILTQFHRFPLDTVKLDVAFTDAGNGNPHHQAVIRAVIVMAHQMDMVVVADGVETRDQADYLRREGCDLLQGGLWAPLEYRGDA